MTEVQIHGFTFEKWVRDEFFGEYEGDYMQKWDIPADHNTSTKVPKASRYISVSIKTAKYGSPIGLGDILRQRIIDCDFLLIVGFWRQRSPKEKWIEDIGVCRFNAAQWNSLWGSLTLAQLQAIDTVVKDTSLPYQTARAKVRAWKNSTTEVGTSRIVVNPKIDSKSQRRIQCSLPFSVFWQHAGRDPEQSDAPTLFSFRFPNPIVSGPRKFRQK